MVVLGRNENSTQSCNIIQHERCNNTGSPALYTMTHVTQLVPFGVDNFNLGCPHFMSSARPLNHTTMQLCDL